MTPIRGFGLGDAPRTWQRFDDLSESTGGWRSHAIRTLFGWAPAWVCWSSTTWNCRLFHAGTVGFCRYCC